MWAKWACGQNGHAGKMAPSVNILALRMSVCSPVCPPARLSACKQTQGPCRRHNSAVSPTFSDESRCSNATQGRTKSPTANMVWASEYAAANKSFFDSLLLISVMSCDDYNMWWRVNHFHPKRVTTHCQHRTALIFAFEHNSNQGLESLIFYFIVP